MPRSTHRYPTAPARIWLALFGVLMIGLAQTQAGWALLAGVGWALVAAWWFKEGTAKQCGLLGGVYALVTYHWFLGLMPLSWLGLSNEAGWLITALGWMLLAAHTAVFWALSGWLWQRVQRHALWQSLPQGAQSLLLAPLLAGLITLTECSGTWHPLTLPWPRTGHLLTDIPLWRHLLHHWPATWPTLPLLWTWLPLSLLFWTTQILEALWRGLTRHPRVGSTPRFLGPILVLVLVKGSLTLVRHLPDTPTTPPPQVLHLDAHHQVRILRHHLTIEAIRDEADASASARRWYVRPLQTTLKTQQKATLWVAPEEGALPDTLWLTRHGTTWGVLEDRGNTPILANYRSLLKHHPQHALLVGAYSVRWPTGAKAAGQFNTLVGLSATQTQLYHKRQLAPFGETWPGGLRPFLVWLLDQTRLVPARANDLLPLSFTPGRDDQPLMRWPGTPYTLLPTICFELLDPSLPDRARAAGATVLVNVSNTGWFHSHPAMAVQFGRLAQFQATLSQKPLILSNNEAPSGVFRP